MIVKIHQTHYATVIETTSYEVPDKLTEELNGLSDKGESIEEWVWENGEETDSTTEVEDLHETTNVEVTW